MIKEQKVTIEDIKDLMPHEIVEIIMQKQRANIEIQHLKKLYEIFIEDLKNI